MSAGERPLKLALLVPGGVDRGGTERVMPWLLALIGRLARRGHEVHVFAARQEPEPGRWPLLGATVHNAGRRPRALRMLADVLAEHRRGRFDALHGLWAGMGVIGAVASRLTGTPLVVSLLGGDLVDHPAIGYGGQGSPRARLATRFAVGSARAVTTDGEWMSGLAAGLGIAADPVPLGVDSEVWPMRAPRQRLPGDPLRLLHVASLNRVKDQPTLLRAMALLRGRGTIFELDVAGFDTLGGEVQRLAGDLGLLGCVRFHGFLPQAALRPLFERADILVVSSIHESGPLVLLEAAIAGVPTVGTNVGHVADLAPEAAVAVPVGDAAALAAAIQALAEDEPRRLRLAAASQKRALRIDADFTAATMERIYREAGRRDGSGGGI